MMHCICWATTGGDLAQSKGFYRFKTSTLLAMHGIGASLPISNTTSASSLAVTKTSYPVRGDADLMEILDKQKEK